MNRDELNALRAEARRRHRAVTRKASRLRSKGVEISGSAVDPRRDLAILKRYTQSQLRAYIRQLDSFTDRKTQFVGSAKRDPIPREKWRNYQKVEDAVIARAAERFNQYKDIFMGPAGMTVGERMNMSTPTFKGMRDPQSTVNPNRFARVNPSDIASAAHLDKLMAAARNKSSSGYIDELLRLGRENAVKMLTDSGNHDLIPKIEKLTDRQFEVLWHYSPLPDQLKLDYLAAKTMTDAGIDASENAFSASTRKRSGGLVDWASNL